MLKVKGIKGNQMNTTIFTCIMTIGTLVMIPVENDKVSGGMLRMTDDIELQPAGT